MKEVEINSIFLMKNSIICKYLEQFTYPWEALKGLKDELIRLGKTLDSTEFSEVSEHVWVSKSAKISPTAFIGAPAIICKGAEVRHCAFIRGSAFIGEGTVVGNSTEIKNSILLDRAQVPHFNYVGDSILGYGAHLGGGSILSNLKSDKTEVKIRVGESFVSTGLQKAGSFLGDFVEVGAQSVLNPGSVVGPKSTIYPLSMVRGFVPKESIYKKAGEVVEKYERSEC